MKVYRGYNKDYPNWGTREGQNHIWTTDNLEYAIEYANIFDNGGVVEFEINDSKVKYASEYDYEEILGDEFGADPIDADNYTCQQIIDAGYNVLYFEAGDNSVFLILDKNLIISAREIDYKNHIDNQIDEVLKLSGVELNNKLLESIKYVNEKKSFTKFTTSSYDIKKYLENHKRVRILYDKVNDWYFFDESIRVVHSRLLNDAISSGFYDSDMPNKLIHDNEYDGFVLLSVDNEWDFQDFVSDGYKFAYIYDTYNIYDRDGLYKETPLYRVLGEPNQIINIYNKVYGDEEDSELYENVVEEKLTDINNFNGIKIEKELKNNNLNIKLFLNDNQIGLLNARIDEENVVDLDYYMIEPQYRNKGFGKLLIKTMVKELNPKLIFANITNKHSLQTIKSILGEPMYADENNELNDEFEGGEIPDNNYIWELNESYDYIDEIEVIINPTKKEFNDFVNKNKWYRILLTNDSIAIWSADTPLLHYQVEEEYNVTGETLFCHKGNVYFQDYDLVDVEDDMKEIYIEEAEELDNNPILKQYFPNLHMKQDTIDMLSCKKVIYESHSFLSEGITKIAKKQIPKMPEDKLRKFVALDTTYKGGEILDNNYIWELNEAGYSGYSKSNNAIEAESENKFPASIAAKKLGVSTEAIKNNIRTSEWHHYGSWYNEVYVYDITPYLMLKNGEDMSEYYDEDEINEYKSIYKTMKEESKKKNIDEKKYKANVEYIEWTGTRQRPKANIKKYDNITVIEKGQFYTFMLPDGTSIRKKIDSNGTYVIPMSVVKQQEKQKKEQLKIAKENFKEFKKNTSRNALKFIKDNNLESNSNGSHYYIQGRKPSQWDYDDLSKFYKVGELRLSSKEDRLSTAGAYLEKWNGNQWIPIEDTSFDDSKNYNLYSMFYLNKFLKGV